MASCHLTIVRSGLTWLQVPFLNEEKLITRSLAVTTSSLRNMKNGELLYSYEKELMRLNRTTELKF